MDQLEERVSLARLVQQEAQVVSDHLAQLVQQVDEAHLVQQEQLVTPAAEATLVVLV